MEKTFARVEELADTIKEYVNTRIESVKLSAAEKSSAVVANILAGIFVAGVFLFFIGIIIPLIMWSIVKKNYLLSALLLTNPSQSKKIELHSPIKSE